MRRLALSLSAALLLAACMASPRKAEQSPPVPPPPPEYPTSSPTVTEEGAGEDKAGSAKSGTAANTGATPTLVDDIPHAKIAFDQSEATFTASGSDCAQMCKALASMQRAADHLCDLTKDGADLDKQKCTDARGRVTTAKDRVSKMCGGCGP
ncbi:MAG: hypothetical protein ABI175_15320 [Polyangiales bacterium]